MFQFCGFANLSQTLSPHDHAFLNEAAHSAYPAAAVEHLSGKTLCPQDSPEHSVVTRVVHREYDLALYISCCEILTYSDYCLFLYDCHVIGSSLPHTVTFPGYRVYTHTQTHIYIHINY